MSDKKKPSVGDYFVARDGRSLMQIESIVADVVQCRYVPAAPGLRSPRGRFTLPRWYLSSTDCGWTKIDTPAWAVEHP